MWSVSVCVWVTVCVSASARSACGAHLICGELCVPGTTVNNEHEFVRNGTGQGCLITYKDSDYFHLKCNGNEMWWVFEDAVLPRFQNKFRVPSVTLEKCPPPAYGSIATAVAAFNVELLQTETLGILSLESLPRMPRLAGHHFAGLDRLVSLRISGGDQFPEPAAGFLDKMLRPQNVNSSLLALELRHLRLPPNELDRLPASLLRLTLKSTGVRLLPVGALEQLNLRYLELNEKRLKFLEKFKPPPTLIKLDIMLKNIDLQLDTIPELKNLTLVNWMEKRPRRLKPCGRIVHLQLNRPAVEELPERWLANCSYLEHLSVKHAKYLKTLPANLLQGATALTHITLMDGVLETLPENLFADLNNLISLDLKLNHFSTIPSGVFVGPRSSLQTLNLSYNKLNSSVWKVLESLTELTELNLAYNTHLGDECARNGYSSLNNLKKLKSLKLVQTNITHICYDWRYELLHLNYLYLQKTSISVLRFEDLQFRRENPEIVTTIYLESAPITSVQFSELDYYKSETKLTTGGVLVNLGPELKLECDCQMYWTLLALNRANHTNSGVYGLRCATNRALWSMSEDEMQCPAPDVCRAAELPADCACTARPERGAGGAGGGRMLVTVRCENAALPHVPQLRATAEWIWSNNVTTKFKMGLAKKIEHDDVLYALLLANNSISELRAADLQPRAAGAGSAPPLQLHLRELNLTNNSLKRVAEDAAVLIGKQQNLRVHLAHNQLECDCSIAPLLSVLNQQDISAATCDDGRPLINMTTNRCGTVHVVPPAAWGAGALLALLAAAAVALACFASRHRRLTLVVLLHKLGLLYRKAERNDDCLFDAFISYSHEDEEILRELVERLESGPAPYRLCLHYRDWVLGRLIPEQIAESVRASRRTVALVSRHFLKSTWACAEFREAYALAMADGAPRLVVVLLEEPAALPLDRLLRRYLRTNTYVRWGDPWFWGKLELALPVPRPAPFPPALAVSPDPPLERSLSDEGQPESISLETLPPARCGSASPTPLSALLAPRPERAPARE